MDKKIKSEQALALYHSMFRIKRFEETCHELYFSGKIPGDVSAVYRKTGQIAVCFFGDAASNQGTFHEAVNMAACMNLPVLLVCENNQYGLSTPIKNTCPTCEISDKAHGYGIQHTTCDGMDVEISLAAAREAVDYVRDKKKPYLIEFIAYRCVC